MSVTTIEHIKATRIFLYNIYCIFIYMHVYILPNACGYVLSYHVIKYDSTHDRMTKLI